MRSRSLALAVVSAGALTTLVGGTALGLDRRLETWLMDEAATVVVPEPPAAAIEVAPPSLPPAAAAPVDAPAPTTVADAPVPTAEVVVPDLDGLRVGPARRAMRALGLHLEIRDAGGNAIPPESSPYFRLRGASLSPPAGTAVPPGARVRAEARSTVRSWSGY